MFIKTVKRQGEKIIELEKTLKLEKENNENLRYENVELTLIVKHLQDFQKAVVKIMNSKDTIVNKHDKIKEIVTNISGK